MKEYANSLSAMQTFTAARQKDTSNEIWLVEHPAVFTQGRHGKKEHIIDAHDIPIVQTDRGGQVTYHGPGQLVVYFLFDLKRQNLGIKAFVAKLESMIIGVLKSLGIQAHTKPKQPGVYVNQAKIASIGLRVKNACTYHGIAINVDMDLTPFSYINPCGYAGLNMVQVAGFLPEMSVQRFQQVLVSFWGEHGFLL